MSKMKVTEEETNLSRAKKLESIGILTSSIAHDLNNILTGILGHVSYLRLSLKDENYQSSILAIEDGAKRAAAMTQRILSFARGGEIEYWTVNLSLVISEAINLLSASMPENVKLMWCAASEEILVYGDASQLSQIILNIVVNAKDALINGGIIEVGLDTIVLNEARCIGNTEVEKGEYAWISVKDNGHGIPEEIRDMIFEPFFTTKECGGTGLGLSTVNSIIKSHRGAISLTTKEGSGSCFDIFIPLSEVKKSSETKTKESVMKEVRVKGGNETILVVDDEEAVRVVLQKSLEHLGYSVLTASNGVQGLDTFSNNKDIIDLVVLDMIMPLMSGDELFFEMKKLKPSLKVLISSGYASDDRTNLMLSHGAKGFLHKPFAVEELAAEVRRCIDCS